MALDSARFPRFLRARNRARRHAGLLGFGLTLAALGAGCEDATTPRSALDASAPALLDAFVASAETGGHDGALGVSAADAAAPEIDGGDAAVEPRGDAGDAATRLDSGVAPADTGTEIYDASPPVLDANVNLDAAQADVAHTEAGQTDAAPQAPACTDDVCCMPLTKAEGSATCPRQACMSQGQALRVAGAAGEKARLRCFGAGDSALRYNGSDGELSLNLDPQHCSPDTGDVRAGAQGAFAVAHAVDAQNGDELLAMVDIKSGSVKELTVRDGRVHLVVEGAVLSSTSAAEVSFDCTHGGTLPLGICNCFFAGAGPVATITYDLPLLMQ